MNLTRGTIVGKYKLESPLAQGGMGAVWMAHHVRLGTPVAVKFLSPALAGSRRSLARFEREAHAATVIQSPHVIQVHDFGVEGETPYLVMELLHGENLGARLQRHKRLSLAEAARILIQVGKALRRAHAAGIVHRDIKPGNLFLAYDDDEEIVKILDFGIAKTTDTPVPEQTEPGTMLGSPNYMSPEQAAGDRTVDHRSDLWSMAVVLYQTVTGELPFQGHTMGNVLKKVFIEAPPRVTELAPDLPAELDDFFHRALAKKRHERFQSIDEMVMAFVSVAAPDQSVPPPSLRHASRAEPKPCDPPEVPLCSEPEIPTTPDSHRPAGGSESHANEVASVPTVRLGRISSRPPAIADDPVELPPIAPPRVYLRDDTPSPALARSDASSAATDSALSNSVTLHGRPAGSRRLASVAPWLVVAVMLAVPLFFALFRSPEAVGPDRVAPAGVLADDGRTAAGGAPRMDAPGAAPSVTPSPDLASVPSGASSGVATAGDGAAAPPAITADPAASGPATKAERAGNGDPARAAWAAGEALSESDVYDDPPAGARLGGTGKTAASAAPEPGGAPVKRDVRPASPGSGAPEKRWF